MQNYGVIEPDLTIEKLFESRPGIYVIANLYFPAEETPGAAKLLNAALKEALFCASVGDGSEIRDLFLCVSRSFV